MSVKERWKLVSIWQS